MNEKKILSIQALRGVVAVSVVFDHCQQNISFLVPVGFEKYLGQNFGAFGVDIFFVISGFVMVYINRNNFGQKNAILPFIIRRIARILPLYWLVTLFVLVILIPSGLFKYPFFQQDEAANHLRYIVQSILLLPSYNAHGVRIPPVVVVGWSLVFEMFFYYIFCLLIMFDRKKYLPILSALFLCLIVTQTVIHHFHFQWMSQSILHMFDTYGNSIILEFIFGCIVAERYLSGKVLSNKTAVFAIVVSMIVFISCYHIPATNQHFWQLRGLNLIFLPYHMRAICCGLPAAFFVYGFLSLEANGAFVPSQFLQKLGDASYSIYLVHQDIFFTIFTPIVKYVEKYVPIPGDLVVLIGLVSAVYFGLFFYRYCEVPIIKFSKKCIRFCREPYVNTVISSDKVEEKVVITGH